MFLGYPLLRYKDPSEPEKIGMEGVVKFLDDLQLDATSRTVLIIAWKFKAQQQCEFSREEFLGGMIELGCDTIDKLKAKLPNLEKEILDQNKFKEFYQFTFNYAKNPSQKVFLQCLVIASVILSSGSGSGDGSGLLEYCYGRTIQIPEPLESIPQGAPQEIHPQGHVESSAGLCHHCQ